MTELYEIKTNQYSQRLRTGNKHPAGRLHEDDILYFMLMAQNTHCG